MRKHLLVGLLAAVFAVALAAPAAAQDNVTGLGADEGAAGTVFLSSTANNNYFSKLWSCTDDSASFLSGAVADCCIAGDIWQLNVHKAFKGAHYQHTANVNQFAPGGAAFSPDVYSPNATVFTRIKNISVKVTSGNTTPGGHPAGLTVRVVTNGFGPFCRLRAVVNGS